MFGLAIIRPMLLMNTWATFHSNLAICSNAIQSVGARRVPALRVVSPVAILNVSRESEHRSPANGAFVNAPVHLPASSHREL